MILGIFMKRRLKKWKVNMYSRCWMNEEEFDIDFVQETMSRHSTHLDITTYEGEDKKYVKDNIEIFMSIVEAALFVEKFRNSLDKYKKAIRYVKED